MDRGAHFVKTDLQVHTPRDPNWHDKCVTDADRDQFSRELIAACRTADLGAIAITDHHDFAFLPYVRNAAASEVTANSNVVAPSQRVVVFPGLELAIAVPCQALLIFSADFPGDRLSAVLDKLGIDPAEACAPRAKDPTQLPFKTFRDLYDRLDETAWLRGQYVVLPNVTDGGYQTLMRAKMQASYRDMPCVGGYLDSGISEIGRGNRRIFDGLDANWGNKRIAVVQTSDARSFAKLGSNATWIKWAEPTGEALRQACLAEESRISHVEPAIPSVHVTRLTVSNSKFLGPLTLELNAQYNALIGGRGTGKSSCLEYLRWGLCDQPPTPATDGDGLDLPARRRRLVELTLHPMDAHVEVHFLLNGIPHVVRRYARTGDLQLKVGANDLAPASQSEVRALLPIQAYSQRQLSDVGVHLDELTRFVTAPIQDQLDELDSRRDELSAAIRENFVHLQRVRTLERSVARDKLALASLDQQAAAVRETLSGLSDTEREVLRAKPTYDEGDALVETTTRRAGQAVDELERAATTIAQLRSGVRTPVAEALPERETLDELQRDALELLAAAEGSVREALVQLRAGLNSGSGLAQLHDAWAAQRAAFELRYEAATTRSTAHAAKLEELTTLEKRRGELQQTLNTQAQQLELLGNPATRHIELRGDWLALQAERTARLNEQCARLTDLSDQLIRATIRQGAGTSTHQQRFKSAVQGSGVRTAKIETFLDAIAADQDPLAAWHAALDELEQILLAKEVAATPGSPPSTALKAFTTGDLERTAPRLTPEAILELSLLPLDDHPVFEYRSEEGEYIEFADASAGQQATALLRMLLNQGGPPLLIDQPEDDLDSQVIQDVVNLLWEAKGRRQLIFSSHNANLVVNGDAELVACFNYRSAGDHSAGHIELEGAIDVPSMREKITTVMEGGEKAFRLRQEKYGF